MFPDSVLSRLQAEVVWRQAGTVAAVRVVELDGVPGFVTGVAVGAVSACPIGSASVAGDVEQMTGVGHGLGA